MEFLRSIPERHTALKKRIHAFRYPLSPFYLKIAQVVYISVPIVIGYGIMEWTTGQAKKNLGDKGQLMKKNSDNATKQYNEGTSGQNVALQSVLDYHKAAMDKSK